MRVLKCLLVLFFAGNIAYAQGADMAPQDGGGEGLDFHMGLSAGAVVLDGELYNQIGIRPLITFGKLGIALDLSIYMDSDGNIREENWDDASDLFEKLYYVRWARPGDPFYLKVGAIDNFRLGYGLLMNHYANTVEYPNVIRTGMEIGVDTKNMGFEGMVNNFSESIDGGGVYAGRYIAKFVGGLQMGFSVVADANQYKGLKDRDKDGVPDFADDFPNRKRYQVDSDGDGKPDEIDFDRDGDGFTDNVNGPNDVVIDSSLLNDADFDPANLKGDPFNINKAKDKAQIAVAVDLGLPIIEADYLNLVVYSQYAQFLDGGGWGITAPGIRAKFAFINAFAEYRIFGEKFLPEYFNNTYELERAVFFNDSIVTKSQVQNSINEALQGYVIGADFNIADFLVFGAEYQNMSKKKIEFKTFRASLDLNATLIPKISQAGAYYVQNNAETIFKRSAGTILGYRFGYDIGGGATLVMDFRQTYRDLDGNGKIQGDNEIVKSTLIQTVFTF